MRESPIARLLTVDQVAAELGLRSDTLLAWAKTGRVPHMRIGRRLMFKPEHVDQFRHLRPHRPAWRAALDTPVCAGIYFVTGADRVKIGIVGKLGVRTRMTGLQNGSPVPLTLHRFVAHQRPLSIERGLHSRFSIFHAHGEWFDAAPVLADIEAWPDDLFARPSQWPAVGGQSGGQSGQEIAQSGRRTPADIPQTRAGAR